MNRRHFLRTYAPAALAIPAVLAVPRVSLVSAQENDVELFEYNFKGVDLSVVQYWEARYTRESGAITLSTTYDSFESDRRARTAYRQFDQYVDDYFAFWADQGYFEEQDREDTSPSKLGARRRAALSTVQLAAYELEAFVAIMFVQKGAVLHKWLAVGLDNPSEELFDLADKTMGFAAVDDDSSDKELVALLPTEDDVPSALSLMSEFIERYEVE